MIVVSVQQWQSAGEAVRVAGNRVVVVGWQQQRQHNLDGISSAMQHYLGEIFGKELT
jgi:hypothetical protein